MQISKSRELEIFEVSGTPIFGLFLGGILRSRLDSLNLGMA